MQQQFIVVVNGLHGDGEALKGKEWRCVQGEEGSSKGDRKAFNYNEEVLN